MTKEEAREAYARKIKVRKGTRAKPTRVHTPKKAYDRKNTTWKEEQV